ncbi:MAG TPA: hypothetical protein VJT72_04445 [Pseudonocardiaceae bacterium]|nr:hypothetical protein [Pseudonocardiaceae bacterium]
MTPSQPGEPFLPMRPASDIPRTNAGSLTHEQLMKLIAGVNSGQVHELSGMWNTLGSEVHDFGAILQRATVNSELSWAGEAGEAARARLDKLVGWCTKTGDKMQHMGTAVMRAQAEAAATARMSMPAPVPYDPVAYQNQLNSTSNPIEWAQILGDAREQAELHNAAYAAAIRVIETYSASLLSTNGAMPAFTPPPEPAGQDTELGPDAPAQGVRTDGAAVGIPRDGGSPQIASDTGGSGSGDASQVPGGGFDGGASPDSGGHSPDGEPRSPTPGQVAPHVSSTSPGLRVPAGAGGETGVSGLLPATAGIGVAVPSTAVLRASAGGAFGPRGSGGLRRAGLGSVGAAESATGAGRGGAGMAGRGPGAGSEVGGALPPMVGDGRDRGAEDTEHRRPSYLVETEDIWGDGRRVAPPIIGEDPPEYYS